jgi:phosphoribosylformylglycinamidine (FGAM) synthase PurS component
LPRRALLRPVVRSAHRERAQSPGGFAAPAIVVERVRQRQQRIDVGALFVALPAEIEHALAHVEQARAELERMCEQLLANPLIESYEIELAEDG